MARRRIDHLRTERLLLRRWTDADRVPFAELNADPVVMEHFPSLLTRAEADATLDRIDRHFDEHGFGLWAMERLADGVFLGFTGLAVPRFDAHFTPCVEVGWRMARHAWGAGYATEAAQAAVADGFERLELPQIVAMTVPANVRSRAVMERLGMHCDRADDFDHPLIDVDSPVRRHVLYRLDAPHRS